MIEKRYTPSVAEVKKIINSASKPRDRFFLTLTYLTAGRVTEVLDIKKEDFQVTEKNGIKILLISMVNRKNRKQKIKMIPLRFDLEKDFIDIILGYIEGKEGNLFGFNTRQRGWQIFREHNINPHFFRHIRATHLVVNRGFAGPKLKLYMGWSDSRPEDAYVHLRWEDLL